MLFYEKFLIFLSRLCIFCHSKVFPLKERKVNLVTSLICTIQLEVASMERLSIKERIASGQYIYKCRREGIKMGRPANSQKKTLRIIKRNIKKR